MLSNIALKRAFVTVQRFSRKHSKSNCRVENIKEFSILPDSLITATFTRTLCERQAAESVTAQSVCWSVIAFAAPECVSASMAAVGCG